MTIISDLHQQWLNDPEYKTAYEAQCTEFEIASAIIALSNSCQSHPTRTSHKAKS
jgi:hypothetical protein